VPVIPEVLRAKVKVFAELYRKTRELETLNAGLEARVKERTAALEATAARLRESEQRRSLALAAGQMGSWDWDLVRNDVQWDDGQYAILGVERAAFPITLANLRRVVHAADCLRLEELIRGLSAEAPSAQAEFRIRRPDGELRWCFGTAAATVADDGQMVRISGVTIDITERRRTEEQQALLVREVDHRAKNVLAVVQSIVRLSHADTVPGYVAAIEGRIQALSRVHGLLAQARWEGTDLRRLITDELSPYAAADGVTIRVDGPSITVDPSTAQALALALHELSTNAAKYGALSRPGGRIEVKWDEDKGFLTLVWTERGGPPASRPGAPGFGLKVIGRSVDAQLGGRVDFKWRKEGLTCTLTVPLTESAEAQETEPALSTPTDGASGQRATVMVVEDEALVAIMMADLLVGLGYGVVGPIASVAQSLRPAEEAEIDAALLDVTLGHERIYPVAEILTRRGVPYAFLTGYGREGIDPRFAGVPVLQKPVDEAALAAFLAQAIDNDHGTPADAALPHRQAETVPAKRAAFQFDPKRPANGANDVDVPAPSQAIFPPGTEEAPVQPRSRSLRDR
jgi:PAS domain S-box-containing protein